MVLFIESVDNSPAYAGNARDLPLIPAKLQEPLNYRIPLSLRKMLNFRHFRYPKLRFYILAHPFIGHTSTGIAIKIHDSLRFSQWRIDQFLKRIERNLCVDRFRRAHRNITNHLWVILITNLIHQPSSHRILMNVLHQSQKILPIIHHLAPKTALEHVAHMLVLQIKKACIST